MTTALPPALSDFVSALEGLLAEPVQDEALLLPQVQDLMRLLVAQDDWLDPVYAQDHPQFYQQHLLHADDHDRFSVVSFVWGPGQQTPVHDHLVWGVIGMLRGSENGQPYQLQDGVAVAVGTEDQLWPGDVACVSPRLGDMHRVRNAYADQVSISIHAYGGNIGRIKRHVFTEGTAQVKDFISGYSALSNRAA